MKRILIIPLLFIGIIMFSPIVLADEFDNDSVQEAVMVEKTTVMTESGVQSISPEEGVRRINTALLNLYKAGASMIPNIALTALVIGAIMAMFAAALSLEKLLRASIVGMVVVFIAVAIVYAGPLLTAMAKGFGEGL